MTESYFARYATAYDRIQPVHIEMYRTYHRIALDFIPFESNRSFQILDLGCGTGTFLASVLDRWPNATAVALDFSEEMLGIARHKVAENSARVDFQQRDLNEGLPDTSGSVDIVTSFSAIHHLADENKRKLFREIHDALVPGGWLFLIDAMITPFDDTVFRIGTTREARERAERFQASGISNEEIAELEQVKARLAEDAADRDRISPYDVQMEWLEEAGFGSIDHIWHFWMEHFVIARKS